MSDSALITHLNAALEGRYRIESELGEGGMATVYLADDLRHERKVALKVLKPDLAASLGHDRFLQEVRITANLQHPHILPLFDSGEADGFLFYVMPHVDGETLKDRLAHEGELPVSDAARILHDVVDALSAAHAAGVIHRDIKPANILLRGRHAIVADFGVAKAISEAKLGGMMTTVGTSLGTPAYMSPEQAAADEAIDHRTDIYAVGAMAYEVLTGSPPFTGSTHRQVLTAHITKTPDPVTEHRRSVPVELGVAIMRCLEKKRADRWQHIDELLPYLEAATTSSRGMTPVGMPPVKRPGGRRVPMKGVMAGVALAGVVGALLLWRWPETGPAQGAVPENPRILVAPPENRTGDPSWDSWGAQLTDEMRRAISQNTTVDIVSGALVRTAAQGLTDQGSVDLVDLARQVRGTHIFASSFSLTDDVIAVTVEVLDGTAGESLRVLNPIRGSLNSLDSIVAQSGNAVAIATMMLVFEPDAFELRFASLPVNPNALQTFQSGVSAFQDARFDDAESWFSLAIEREPTWPRPYVFLRMTYENLGRTREVAVVDSLLQPMFSLMTPVDRTLWETGAAPAVEDRIRAADEGFRLTAGAGYTGFLLGFTAVQRSQFRLAREGLDSVDFDRLPMRDWAPASVLDDKIYHLLGSYREELASAALHRVPFPDNPYLARDEVRALAGLGDIPAAESATERLYDLPVGANAVWNVATDAAFELVRHGHPDASARSFRRLLTWVEQGGELSRYRRAQTYYNAARYEEAVPLFEQELLETDGMTRLPRAAMLIISLERLGRMEEAQQYETMLSFPVDSGDPDQRWVAAVAATRNDPATAVRVLRTAFRDRVPHYMLFDDFMHSRPEFNQIRADPAFSALMAPRE
jgi:tRNA A-37 threonylcarbamoyl transferase component Bud32/TolB-like protein